MRFSIIAVVLAAALLAGCDKAEKNPGVPQSKVDGESILFPPGSPQLSSLVSEAASQRPAAATALNGRLTWHEDRTVRVFTPLAGRVDRILVQPGDRVNQG